MFNLLVHQVTNKPLKLQHYLMTLLSKHSDIGASQYISTEATQSQVFLMKGAILTGVGWCLGGFAPEKFAQ